MKRSRALWTTIVLSAAIGCGSNRARGGSQDGDAATGGTTGTDSATGTDSFTGTASTWVSDLTAAYCMWAIRCGKFSGAATCRAYMGPQFAVVNFNAPSAAITAVSKGTAQFDPTRATSCLTALANLDCDSDLLFPTRVPTPCAAVFVGNLSDGSACIDDVECPNGSICLIASTVTCKGTCTPLPAGACRTIDDCPAQQHCAGVPFWGSGLWGSGGCQATVAPGATEGDACGTPVQCAPGLLCHGGPPPRRCSAVTVPTGAAAVGGGVGAVCGFVGTCARELACVRSDDGTTSTCMPPAKLGDACTSLFQCGAQYRLSDIICDKTGTRTCVHLPSTGRCRVVVGMNTCDPTTSYCDAATGTCKPWLSQGDRCAFNGIDPLWTMELLRKFRLRAVARRVRSRMSGATSGDVDDRLSLHVLRSSAGGGPEAHLWSASVHLH